MEIKVYHTSSAYLDDTLAYLEKQPVINSLLIGLVNRRKQGFFFSVHEEGVVLLSGTKIGQRNLILTGQVEYAQHSLAILINHFVLNKMILPGVFGPLEITEYFTDLWCEYQGCKPVLDFNEMIYQATEIKPIRTSPGYMIRASELHQALVEDWIVAFSTEAGEPKTRFEAKEIATNKIKRGEFYIWLNEEEPVAMAATTRPTRHTISINSVYTPPRWRGHGYATSCVHAITEKMLESYSAVTLFTDLKNPTSNSIYQKIGYVPVKEFLQMKFVYS